MSNAAGAPEQGKTFAPTPRVVSLAVTPGSAPLELDSAEFDDLWTSLGQRARMLQAMAEEHADKGRALTAETLHRLATRHRALAAKLDAARTSHV